MSFVFIEQPVPEEKYQTRTATVHSEEFVHFPVSIDSNVVGIGSLVLLHYPCTPEQAREQFKDLCSAGTITVFLRIGDDHVAHQDGDLYLLRRDVLELSVPGPSKIASMINSGVPKEDVARLLQQSGDNVDAALELWWAEEFGPKKKKKKKKKKKQKTKKKKKKTQL